MPIRAASRRMRGIEVSFIDDVAMIATSFPEFEGLMRYLGANFVAVNS